MLKTGPKIFRIISLFCLRKHFAVLTWLTFIQNLGNYSFVCIHWTVYCVRIHYHLLESYWVVLLEWQKFMVSLQFIFCWRKHFCLMIIQKDFFYLIAITYWKLIPSAQKWVMTCSNIPWTFSIFFKKSGYVTSDCIEWCHKTYFSWNRWKTAYHSKNITWKVFRCIIFESNNIIAFYYSSKLDK